VFVPLSIVTTNSEQPLNAVLVTVVTFLGMKISSKEVQPSNDLSEILVIVVGILTSFKEVQPLKRSSLMTVNLPLGLSLSGSALCSGK
jgi:hypothetical protein